MISLPRGTIVCARNILDPNGVNPKDRFLVLIRDFVEGDASFHGVAITSTFSDPLSDVLVSLPYSRNPRGRCKTGLTRDSVAVCNWIVTVPVEDLLEKAGFTPPFELNAILDIVDRLLPPSSE